MINSNFAEQQNQAIDEKVSEITSLPNCVDNINNILFIFSIYDRKLEKYSPFTLFTSFDEAKLQYKNVVDFGNNLISHYPENYDLYCFGHFDFSKGLIQHNPAYMTDTLVSIGQPIGFIGEFVCNLKDLQSDEANQYYSVLNSVNASLNSLDFKLQEFKQLDLKLSETSELIAKRMARIDAIMDNNVDLFPIPVKSKDIANNLTDKVESVQQKHTNFFKKILS